MPCSKQGVKRSSRLLRSTSIHRGVSYLRVLVHIDVLLLETLLHNAKLQTCILTLELHMFLIDLQHWLCFCCCRHSVCTHCYH